MGRLEDRDVARLVSALASNAPQDVRRDSNDAEFATHRDRIAQALAAATLNGNLDRKLTLELATYLNKAVRCSAELDAPGFVSGWRFEAAGDGFTWWLSLEDALAASMVDAMIGGDGYRPKVVANARTRRLIERIAERILRVLATEAAVSQPGCVTFVAAGEQEEPALVGGTCAVVAQAYGWRAGAAPRRAQREPDAATTLSGAIQLPASEARRWPIPASKAVAPDICGAALARAMTRMEEMLRCPVVFASPLVTNVTEPTLPSGQLSLALLVGGHGALVLSADQQAVLALVEATLASAFPSGAQAGVVVRCGAEAVLRAALAAFAEALPGIAGEVNRIERLTEGALPARTEHVVLSVYATVGGFAAGLRWLIPAWMAPKNFAPPATVN